MAYPVYVSGYKRDTALEDLIIHFQSDKSNVGDIDDEQCEIDKEEAVIAFEEKEDQQRVLKTKQHKMGTFTLNVSESTTKSEAKPGADIKDVSKKLSGKPNEDNATKYTRGDITTVIVGGICPETSDEILSLFFENDRRSGGGDIKHFKRVQPDIAHITYESSEVAQRVLQREKLEVEGYLLDLKPEKPKVIFPLDKTKLLIENIPEDNVEENLTMYVELISGLDVVGVVIGKKNNAIVTLNGEPDMNKVIEKAKKKRLAGSTLKVSNPPVCHSILVTGLSPDTTEDMIELKFESPKYGGGEILEIHHNKTKGEAVISFIDPNVVNTINCRVLHNAPLTTQPYYGCLEDDSVIVEEERYQKRMIKILPDIMQHVSNRCNEDFFDACGLNINEMKYDEENEELFITNPSEVDKIEEYFNQFTVNTLEVEQVLVIEAKNEIQEILGQKASDVSTEFNEEKQCIILTGKRKIVKKCKKTVKKQLLVLEKKKEITALEVPRLEGNKLKLMRSLGFECQFDPKLKVNIDLENGAIKIKGPTEQVDGAKMKALEEYSQIKEDYLDLNRRQLEYLESVGIQIADECFKDKKLKAVLCLDETKPNKAVIVMVKSEDLAEIIEFASDQIYETCYTLAEESHEILRSEKWTEMQNTAKQLKVMISVEGNKIWLTGERTKVPEVKACLKKFVEFNSIVVENIAFDFGIVRYLQSYSRSDIERIEDTLKNHVVKVECGRDEGIRIQGTRNGVKEAKKKLQGIVDRLVHDKILIKPPGMQKHLKTETGKTTLKGIETDHKCTINIASDRPRRIPSVAGPSTSATTPLCSYETPEKITMHVYQADITKHTCDVLVNAANEGLDHIGGLAWAVVNNGGEEIQKECHSYVKNHRRLTQGEFYKGIAGRLPCKNIIHVVGPRWDNFNRVTHMNVLHNACENIFKDAGKKDKIIALPAVGSGVFGVPREICAKVMVDAAIKWSSTDGERSSLREIHFVNNDTQTAQVFVKEFRKQFGDHQTYREGAPHQSQPKERKKQPKEREKQPKEREKQPKERKKQPKEREKQPKERKKQTKSTNFKAATRNDTPAAYSVPISNDDSITTKTQRISVVIGDISTHKADVLVNTTSEQLDLSRNPCSRAYSSQGGPALQKECNKIGTIKVGEVGETPATGNLQCTSVYHVVCVQYDNGKGELILRSIIKECLKACDSSGHSSIAFPAIGTGILGFPHNVTAKICFEEVKKFGESFRNSSVNDISFVMYHQDQASIRAFKEEIKRQSEWNKSAPGPSRKESRNAIDDDEDNDDSNDDDDDDDANDDDDDDEEDNDDSNDDDDDSNDDDDANDDDDDDANDDDDDEANDDNRDDAAKIVKDENNGVSIALQDGTIRILKGDITKETTDVIAHLSNEEGSMNGGVAKALIKSGGKAIEKQRTKEGKIQLYGTVLTKAGNLNVRAIAHMAGPDGPDEKDIEKCITNCLQKLTNQNYRSVSFPAIGTGQLSMSAKISAQAMLTAIVKFLQNNPGLLDTVRIVIYDNDVFTKFLEAAKQLFAAENDDQTTNPTLWQRISNFLSRQTYAPIGKMKAEPADKSMELIVYADTTRAIKDVKLKIEKIIKEQMKKDEIKDDHVEKLSKKHEKQIIQECEGHNVKVKIEKHRIIMEGHKDDVSEAKTEIYSIMNESKMAKNEEETAEFISQNVQWSWLDSESNTNDNYPLIVNKQIETAYKKKQKTFTFEMKEEKCEIDFKEMIVTNKATQHKTQVSRNDLKKATISRPQYWDPQPIDANGKEKPLHVVLLNQATQEYKTISDGFLKTAQNHTIQKIERIQNPTLFKLYMTKKQDMDERHGSNEKTLYHGTNITNVPEINQSGLNRSYKGKNGVALGQGIYFARDASTSVGYAVVDVSGNRCMYVARVSVGQYTQGKRSMIVPPTIPGSHTQKYNSVVDNVTNPGIFVMFYDNEYYPEYLITFR